ncbi:MAG: LCP family protein [Cellulosilyticaceae bacterium]
MNKKQLIKVFMITVGVCLGVCGILLGGGIVAYNLVIRTPEEVVVQEQQEVISSGESVTTESINKESKEGINQTLVVFGTDKDGNRTDVIFAVRFDSLDKKVDVISIPRDTKVEWTDAQRACLPEGSQGLRTSKINEMTHYSHMKYVRGTVISEIEMILGTEVDHYVMISLDAFRKIVDAIGGVEVDVPRRMKKDDYAQDLHIDLQPGLQLLDGDKAEQFVRFRDYPEGDVDRISAQQQFLKAFADKVMSTQVITRIPQIITVLFTSVRTDMSFIDVVSYLPYLKEIDLNQLQFHTVPGEGRYEEGISYYFIDEQKTKQLVNEVYFEN